MSPLVTLQQRPHGQPRKPAVEPDEGLWPFPAEAVLVWTPERGWHGLIAPPDWWWEALEA